MLNNYISYSYVKMWSLGFDRPIFNLFYRSQLRNRLKSCYCWKGNRTISVAKRSINWNKNI